jgi:hypothetical protein
LEEKAEEAQQAEVSLAKVKQELSAKEAEALSLKKANDNASTLATKQTEELKALKSQTDNELSQLSKVTYS